MKIHFNPGQGAVSIIILYSRYYFFLALIFLIESPVSSILCAVCTILSRIASATVGSPIASYQLSTGSCDVIMIDFNPCQSSIISIRIDPSLASSPIRNRSLRMNSEHFSIFFISASIVPLFLAILNCPISFDAL